MPISAVGGFNGKAFLNTIEYFDMENDQWTTSVTILDSICSVNYLLKNGCDNDKQEENYSASRSRTRSSSFSHHHHHLTERQKVSNFWKS